MTASDDVAQRTNTVCGPSAIDAGTTCVNGGAWNELSWLPSRLMSTSVIVDASFEVHVASIVNPGATCCWSAGVTASVGSSAPSSSGTIGVPSPVGPSQPLPAVQICDGAAHVPFEPLVTSLKNVGLA